MQRLNKGTEEAQLFDVTDYEGFQDNHRRQLSPMQLFMFICEERVPYPKTKQFFMSDLFENWLSARKMTNTPFIILWFIFRLVLIAGFLVYDLGIFFPVEYQTIYSLGNVTGSIVSQQIPSIDLDVCRNNLITNFTFIEAYFWFLVILTSSLLLYDFGELFYTFYYYDKIQRNYYTEMGKKNTTVVLFFYRGMQFTCSAALLIGACYMLHYIYTGATENSRLITIVYLLVSTGQIWFV